ncbi:efflux RND transporter permease subunit [Adhaeretor mobilis]|uniref:MMPL family protein n=1 Tax=Adhaeretor mobilis TaxID=1930276 RepID=A0A517MWZ9_9BACT|nr:MMPL family transporter [Adhaeretor mobilis]QDS99401.1 MMPL family protein [Adhaeretor mobilis]
MNQGRDEPPKTGTKTRNWAYWLVAHRKGVLAAVLAITAVSAVIAVRIDYDFTPQAIFSGENELVAYSEQVKATFGHAENIIIVVLQATSKEDCLTPAALKWQLQFADDAVGLPEVDRVDSLATTRLPRPRLFGGTGLMFVPVIREGTINHEEAQLVREKVNDQPLLEGTLISPDRRFTALVLHLDPRRKDIDHVTAVVSKVEQLTVQSKVPAGFRAFLGGLPTMRAAIVQGLQRDQITIIPLAALVFALVQIVLFRSWTGVVVSAAAVATGLAWTMAALVLLGQSLTIISNVLPILLMIVGVSSCVHFLNEYAEQLQRGSVTSKTFATDAAARTTQRITLACLLTSLTTALGFLSLLAARSQLLGALGWQAAMGIGLFFIATVLVCSGLMPIYRPTRQVAPSGGPPNSAHSPLARGAWAFGRWAIAWPRLTVSCGVALLFIAGLIGRNTEINSNLLETFDKNHPQTQQMHLLEEQLGGFVPMEIILSSDTQKWFLTADHWLRLCELEIRISTQSGVINLRSLVGVMREVDRQLPGGRQLPNLVDDPSKLERRLEECYQALKQSSKHNATRYFVTEDDRQLRILMNLRDLGTQGTLDLADWLAVLLEAKFPPTAASRIETRITGESYVAAVALTQFIRDLLFSLLGVSGLIFIVIGLVLRSPRLGLISILPNIAPLVVTLGYLGIRGYTISMSNVIVFAISLGVAVDDTIHFLARFRHEIQGKADLTESDIIAAIRRTCLGTGRAVLMTTILIVCGMAILLLSTFVPTRRFAELAAVTMLSALLGDLLLLPAMLKLFWPTGKSDRAKAAA